MNLKTLKPTLFALLFVSGSLISSFANARPVTCQIELTGYAPYKGTCEFKAGRNGSFDLTNFINSANLFKNVMLVGVDVQAPGIGEAVVIYDAGPKAIKNTMVNTPVERLPQDKACWAGEGVKICAR